MPPARMLGALVIGVGLGVVVGRRLGMNAHHWLLEHDPTLRRFWLARLAKLERAWVAYDTDPPPAPPAPPGEVGPD